MANPEHVEIVRKGVDAIAEWRQQHPQGRLELSEAELANIDLSRANLIWADLTSANLDRAQLVDANLNQARLSYVKLNGADLSGTDLRTAIMRNAELSAAQMIDADLVEADLSGADLSHANLQSANLSKANLSQADLTDACLVLATLNNTNLSKANLNRANLREANLRRARFNDAELVGTHMGRSYLSDADFQNALCGWTEWVDVDLSKTNNLESTRHICSSTVSINTIFRSKGKIPESFLRGCGVAEGFIANIQLITKNVPDFYTCFITYHHKDKDFAQRLYDELQAKGIRCWLDEQATEIPSSSKKGPRGARLWDKTIFCASTHSLSHSSVSSKIEETFNNELKLRMERGITTQVFIPVDLDGYIASDDWTNPFGDKLQKFGDKVRQRVITGFGNWQEQPNSLQQGVDKVIGILAGREPVAQPAKPVQKSAVQKPSNDADVQVDDVPVDAESATVESTDDQDGAVTNSPDTRKLGKHSVESNLNRYKRAQQTIVADSDGSFPIESDSDDPGDGNDSSETDEMPTLSEDDPLQTLRCLIGKPNDLVSGFGKLLKNDGGKSVWYNYAGEKVLCYHVRQRTSGDTLCWESPPVEVDSKTGFINFVFAGSFGAISKPLTDGFVFLVNESEQVDFDLTQDETVWQDTDKKITLIYTPKWQSTSKRDSAGFFYVAISRELLCDDQPCHFSVRSKGKGSMRWFGLQPVTDPQQRQIKID